MTVKELIEALQELPEDYKIVYWDGDTPIVATTVNDTFKEVTLY